jgi:hypothetical protein
MLCGHEPLSLRDERSDQLIERISALSKVRVHTFALFDPFREIAYRAGVLTQDSSYTL